MLEDILLSPTLGQSDGDPVGGFVTGSPEAVALDEGLEKNGRIVVALLPVVGKASCRHTKEHGGEILRLDPGKDEETGIVDDEAEILLLLLSGPADKGVPGSGFPGGGSEAQTGQGSLSGPGDVADLGAGKGLVAEIMPCVDKVVPEFGLEAFRDGTENEVGPVSGRSRVLCLGQDKLGIPDPPGKVTGAGAASFLGGRQDEKTVGLHAQKGRAATHVLGGSVGFEPSEGMADPEGKTRPVESRFVPDPLPDLFKLFLCEGPARVEAGHPDSSFSGAGAERERSSFRSGDISQGSQGRRSSGAFPSLAQTDR